MKVDGVIDANPVASAKQASAVEAAGYDGVWVAGDPPGLYGRQPDRS